MALVCDIKRTPSGDQSPEKPPEEEDLEDGEIDDDDEETPAATASEPQLSEPCPIPAPLPTEIPIKKPPVEQAVPELAPASPQEDKHPKQLDKEARRARHEEKVRLREEKGGHRHMTEAEKSILHLRKREKMMRDREKWERAHRKDADGLDDDFAKHIEKTLATILHKKEKEAAATASGEEEKEDKKGKKRKMLEKGKHKVKQRRIDSPRSEIDENEMLNIRSGSPDSELRLAAAITTPQDKRSLSPSRSEESYESEYSTDELAKSEESRMKKKRMARNRRKREIKKRNRKEKQRKDQPEVASQPQSQQNKVQLQDSQGVCVFYMQGKCQKNDCPYSHEASPPMKLELCKFYLMDCCAKGANCSYMHSEFPCKFYHTGLQCNQGEDCKFAHGASLSDGLKQILFKHIETAPRDILGGFPRMSREEALNLINVTQKKLQDQYEGLVQTPNGQVSLDGSKTVTVKDEPKDIKMPNKNDKSGRNRQSRWQQQENESNISSSGFSMKSFSYGSDQDMRINSNGDIDMRTLPGLPSASQASISTLSQDGSESSMRGLSKQAQDLDIRGSLSFSRDVDIRSQSSSRFSQMDTDIRQLVPKSFEETPAKETDTEDELHIDTGEDKKESAFANLDLSKSTLDLIARITANQRDNTVPMSSNQFSMDAQSDKFDVDDSNINWYSDDDDEDENRLTIKVDEEDNKIKDKEEEVREDDRPPMHQQIKPTDIVGKLGDLSKIDISAEVTKLLTSMSQNRNPVLAPLDPRGAVKDPRVVGSPSSSQEPMSRLDPRLSSTRPRQSSTDSQDREPRKPEKLSIYEQGGIDMQAAAAALDVMTDDIKTALRPDIDLRNLVLPFKGMQNYTPATEIDASVNAHPPIVWRLREVEVPRPDYTGLKLSVSDAEKTGDPRLRKLFRLSVDEKDSPASPKASPKAAGGGTRIDPRLRKMEEKTESSQMSYSQQLNVLQSSQFYQSLTSNQKLLLNQELSARNEGGGHHDPVLNQMLSSLNLLPTPAPSTTAAPLNTPVGAALSILAGVNKINPMLAPQAMLGQPGLLGAAPGIPNLPPDFPINFDPRNGGLLGNAPPQVFGGGPGGGPFPPMDGSGFGNFEDDFYPGNNPHPGPGKFRGHGRGGDRGGFGGGRDRRRGRNFGNRNNRNFKSGGRINRPNRNHSPP